MPTPKMTPEKMREALAALEQFAGNVSHAAMSLGLPRGTFQTRIEAAKRCQVQVDKIVSVEAAPDPNEPLADLIARKKAGMQRAKAHEEWAKLIPVSIHDTGPIGVLLVGDPHVDDDGCDIHQLEHDLSAVGRTKGFYAGHIGDLTNNWVGRLARLYAHQSTSFGDGLRLTEWMLGLCANLFVVNGNHDCWEKGGDLLRFIVKAGAHQSHGARLALRWPGGQEIRLHARHDFPGRSQFSDTHGMKRELLWGHKDHILVCGHTHVDEARVEPGASGDVHWMFRVSGYKVIDEYAKEHHFRPKRMAPSVSVVIRPDAHPAERVKPFWDAEEAADWLTFLRKRKTS
jgi:predicted phosphodiesterase